MASPTLAHEGFLVPNAVRVSSPRMAEPDQVDFNTLANSRWGVVEGCLVTVSGSMALALPGLAVVDGELVTVAGGSVPLGVGGPQDRFDLLAVNRAGTFVVIPGDPSNDPVFKDVDPSVTVLAAVYCPSGASNFSSNVIDKRKFVPQSLLTSVDPASMLIQNKNSSGNHFTVTGDGTFNWEGDTSLWRVAPSTLRISTKIIVDSDITSGGALTGSSLTVTQRVTGSNISSGSNLPGSAVQGAIFQDEDDGRLYVWKGGSWKELATTDAAQPVGTVLTSVEPPSVMVPLGWVPLDGRTVSEGQFPKLFTLTAFAGRIEGDPPNRSIKLPNASGKVMMTQWGQASGQDGGHDNNQIALTTANMPQHKHNVSMDVAGSGPIAARVTRSGTHGHGISGGTHDHTVNDPEHNHNGAEWINGTRTSVIAVVWGGQNKIDALFNDRNHTYSVEALDWIDGSRTGVTINSVGTNGQNSHSHLVDQAGDHDHAIQVDSAPNHIHTVSEQNQGSGAAFDITPSYLTVYTYLRT